jgi:hypothetical protein
MSPTKEDRVATYVSRSWAAQHSSYQGCRNTAGPTKIRRICALYRAKIAVYTAKSIFIGRIPATPVPTCDGLEVALLGGLHQDGGAARLVEVAEVARPVHGGHVGVHLDAVAVHDGPLILTQRLHRARHPKDSRGCDVCV